MKSIFTVLLFALIMIGISSFSNSHAAIKIEKSNREIIIASFMAGYDSGQNSLLIVSEMNFLGIGSKDPSEMQKLFRDVDSAKFVRALK